MTLELDDRLRGGDLYFGNQGLHGCLHLGGQKHPLRLDLTGSTPRYLQGRHLAFGLPRRTLLAARKVKNPGLLAPQQIGALGKVELKLLPENGSKSNSRSSVYFSLEWYGQNGHITLEVLSGDFEFDGTETPAGCLTLPAFSDDDISRIESSRLVLSHLPHQEDVLAEIIRYEKGMESEGRGSVVRHLYDPPLDPIPPDEITETSVCCELRILLAQLARMGICVNACEHASLVDTYSYIYEHVLDAETFGNFVPVYTVTHYSLWEECPRCEQLFEEEWKSLALERAKCPLWLVPGSRP